MNTTIQLLITLIGHAYTDKDKRVQKKEQELGRSLSKEEEDKIDKEVECLVNIKTTEHKVGNYKIVSHQLTVRKCTSQGMVSKKKWGTDDETYNQYSILQYAIPRSFSVNYIYDENGNELQKFFINGIPKFSSASKVDEDADRGTGVGTACVDLLSKIVGATKVVKMNKANGKFCAISMVKVQDMTILVICSKGVHKFCLIDELDTFINTESGLISGIAKAFKNQYTKLTKIQKGKLISRLTSGFTIIGEYNDGAHLIPLPEEETEPYIEFFGFSKNQGSIPETESLAGNPIEDMVEIRNLGLRTVGFQTYSKEEFDSIPSNIDREGTFTEGFVIYYTNDDGVVLGIEKFKTTWYILWRMLRQIILRLKGPGDLPSKYEGEINKTLASRNEFLNLSDEEFRGWNEILCRFTLWFIEKGYTTETVGISFSATGIGNIIKEWITKVPEETSEPSQ